MPSGTANDRTAPGSSSSSTESLATISASPQLEVHELLVSEVLDHLDRRVEAGATVSQAPVRELDVLGAEADEAPAASDTRAERVRGQDVHGRRADERRDERVRRLRVDVHRRPDLLEDSLAHHRDPVAHRHRLDLVVRHVDRGRAEARLELEDLGARLHAESSVEVRERLVHEERRRLAHDGATERDALPLPARKLLRLALEQLPELEDVRRLAHAPIDLRFGTWKFFRLNARFP